MSNYIFQSDRLGFRNWQESDLAVFAEMNAHSEVMKHFPNALDQSESNSLLNRLQTHYADNGYTYFAVETLDQKEWIGFIGLVYQTYDSPFTPAVDIGWRLHPSAWGKGYATEGAKRCLEFAFEELQLQEVISVCTHSNANSEKVMQKIGMVKVGEFEHEKLSHFPHLQPCLAYSITKDQWSKR